MKDHIGLDIGTSSVKGVRLGADGTILAAEKESFAYQGAEKRRVELSAEVFVETCCRLLGRLAQEGAKSEIGAVCAASASGNLLLLDDSYKPMTPIINWQDGRVGEEARQILKGICAGEIYESSGWSFDWHSFPLAQLCWLKYHEPQLLARCSMICMSTEYLYFRLTGAWGIGRSAGTPFYLIDQRTGKYNSRLLELLEIPEDKLPPVRKEGEVLGGVTEEGAALSGLPVGTPLVLGSFDHPAAAVGAGVLQEGQMLLSCGTSWVGFYPVKDRARIIRCGALADPFRSPEGCWGAMVSVPSVPERMKYFIRRYLGDGGEPFERLLSLAAESEPGAGGLVIDLFTEPEGWTDAQIFCFSKKHIARAVMEGVVRRLQEKMEQLAKEGIRAKEAVMVGGPSESALWMEVVSQMTGLKVTPGKGSYTGAVGAACTASSYNIYNYAEMVQPQ